VATAEIRPGVVYRFFDARDTLLYIGVAVGDETNRAQAHQKQAPWYVFVDRLTTQSFDDVRAADLAEFDAIVAEKPVFNLRNNRTRAAQERLATYLRAAGRLDLLPSYEASAYSANYTGPEGPAFVERAERETGGNRAEMRRRLMAYALEHMPEDWRPAQDGSAKRRTAA
jgi:hypothetical protein